MEENNRMINRGQIIEVDITDMGNFGNGIGHFEGLAIFVENAIPGDKVKAEVTKVKKNYAQAKTVEIVEPSKSRITPDCQYAGQCGGCALRSVNYEDQLILKQKQVYDKINRIGELDNPKINDIVASPETYRYRNKATFAIGAPSKVGYYYRGSNKDLIECEDCLIQPEVAIAITNAMRTFLKELDSVETKEKRGTGFYRKLIVKIAEGTGQIMVVLIVSKKSMYGLERLVMLLSDAVNNVDSKDTEYCLQSVVLNINNNKNVNEFSEKTMTIAGTPTITDIVNIEDEMKFEISPLAFYQVNTKQMINMYKKVMEYAKLTGTETVLDLYCGIGTIGLSMAKHSKMVIGIDEIKPAITDANRNAVINDIINARYYTGKTEDILPRLFDKEDRFYSQYTEYNSEKVAIIDPPRSGCDERVLNTIERVGINRIVYVSCDPATLARDIKILRDLGYEYIEATPFDMFSWTMHVETVVLLTKTKK